MKHWKITACSVVAGFALSLPLSGISSEQRPNLQEGHRIGSKSITVVQDTDKGERSSPKAKRPTKPKVTTVSVPVYNPPNRGSPAPGRRVAGGTRGAGKTLPLVAVLAPGHTGLTIQEQPALYWFVSKVVTVPVEFTLIDENGITPVFEARIAPPVQPGVQRVQLTDSGVRLAPEERYQWSIALVLDPEHRSKDIIAMGAIERINRAETDAMRLEDATKAEAAFRYAEAGLWYDALMAISELIETAPADQDLRKQRAALLDQVGLSEAGAYDLSIRDGELG